MRIFLRPIGSALPLGFFSFGIGMLLLGTQAFAWIPVHEQKDVGMMLMSFVVPLELIATIVAFLARDTIARRRSVSSPRRGSRSAGPTLHRLRARRA